jgi:hypothetical protein
VAATGFEPATKGFGINKMNDGIGITKQLQANITEFLAKRDLALLYKEYTWTGDNWNKGFPEMRQLEIDFRTSLEDGFITQDNVMSVVKWGRLRNSKRVKCPERIVLPELPTNPEDALIALLTLLDRTTKGLGPTYYSKILMFAFPKLYGAIDTRLVTVFGHGDSDTYSHEWLSLRVRNYGSGPHIPETQHHWPSEYITWIQILHFIAQLCNSSQPKCPHPEEYISRGLRDKGIWIAADVETALFSYASKRSKAIE